MYAIIISKSKTPASNIGTYNIMYGSLGAAIALLVWMYLLSLIALLGCAYNAEMERLKKEGVIS